MEKLKMIEANLKKSLDLCEWVLRRERKKRDLAVRHWSSLTLLLRPNPNPRSPLSGSSHSGWSLRTRHGVWHAHGTGRVC